MTLSALQADWANRYARNARIQVIVHTHAYGAVDVTPWVRSAAWGNSMGEGAPSFEITLNDARHTIAGKTIAQQVNVSYVADPTVLLQWANADDPWDLLDTGDWVEIVVNYGTWKAMNYLGWLDTVASADTSDPLGRRDPTTTIEGEAIDAILDMPILMDSRIAGLPAYYNPYSELLSPAFASGNPGTIAIAAITQAITACSAGYPEMPASLMVRGGPTVLLGATGLGEISQAVDGFVPEINARWLAPFERKTIREFISPYLGVPDWCEMWVECRPEVPGAPESPHIPKVVYRMHPWSRADWAALPVTDVGLSSHSLKRGAGGYFNWFFARPQYLPEGTESEFAFIGESPTIPIVDLDEVRKFGLHPLEPSLRWIDPLTMGPSSAYLERMQARLWEWWGIGHTYWQGSLTCNGWRPDIRIGQKVRAKPRRTDLTFYVESYNHSVVTDQNGGIVEGKTELGVSRGQPGDWVDPGIPPQTILATGQTVEV